MHHAGGEGTSPHTHTHSHPHPHALRTWGDISPHLRAQVRTYFYLHICALLRLCVSWNLTDSRHSGALALIPRVPFTACRVALVITLLRPLPARLLRPCRLILQPPHRFRVRRSRGTPTPRIHPRLLGNLSCPGSRTSSEQTTRTRCWR